MMLGLSGDASQHEIKKAYKRLALVYHPGEGTTWPPQLSLSNIVVADKTPKNDPSKGVNAELFRLMKDAYEGLVEK